jgi:hypothetical protein
MQSCEALRTAAEYAGRYWDLANIVTAFAVVQMVAFLYTLGERQAVLEAVRQRRCLVAGLMSISGVVYLSLIILCAYGEREAVNISDSGLGSLARWGTLGRLLIILCATCLGLVILKLDRPGHS